MNDKAPGNAHSNRTIILDSAITAFLAVGYEFTSMDDVANAAGVSRRTVFNQFENKEGLFHAAVESLWGRIKVIDIASEELALSDPERGLRRLGTEVSRFWSQPEAIPLARLVIAEGTRFPFLREGYSLHGRQPALQGMTSYFAALQARGILRDADPETIALQFVGMIKEPLTWPVLIGASSMATVHEQKAVIENAVTVILTCYRK